MRRLSLVSMPALVVLAAEIWGFVAGARVAHANRYLESGLHLMALEACRAAVEAVVWPVAAVGTVLVAAGWPFGRSGIRRPIGWMAVAVLPALLLHAAAAVVRDGAAGGDRNVLWITVDTLRADHLGAYGYRRATSPRIDGLAREGVVFRQAMAQWPKTSPSVASMLSGTYPHTNGVTRFTPLAIGPRVMLVSEILQNAGYRTIAISTHPALTPLYGFAQGFDRFVEAWRDSTRKSARATEEAASWIREHAADGRFFLWIHYMDPHARYTPPPPYDGMFVGDADYDAARRVRLNPGENDDMGGVPGRSRLGRHDELGYYVAQYDGEIRYTDENVGAVLDALRASGVDDRTIIVLTADHGESLGEHGYYFEHGRLPYEDCLRVPLIVRAPGVAPGTVDPPVELASLVPTLLDLLGIPTPPAVQGRTLARTLAGNRYAVPSPAYAGAGYRRRFQRIVRSGQWKLVEVPDESDRNILTGSPFELYDLAADPGELRNLARAEPGRVSELAGDLNAWSARGSRDRRPPAGSPAVDDRTREELRALGYVE